MKLRDLEVNLVPQAIVMTGGRAVPWPEQASQPAQGDHQQERSENPAPGAEREGEALGEQRHSLGACPIFPLRPILVQARPAGQTEPVPARCIGTQAQCSSAC